MCRKGSDRSLKIILCTFKSPFAISQWNLCGCNNEIAPHRVEPALTLMRPIRLFMAA